MFKTKIWCYTKNNFVSKQKVSRSKLSGVVDKNKLMLQKKCISCRQKQDDTAPKKYFVLKKVIIFPERRAIFMNWLILLVIVWPDVQDKKFWANSISKILGLIHCCIQWIQEWNWTDTKHLYLHSNYVLCCGFNE